jgi:hypothetical protein
MRPPTLTTSSWAWRPLSSLTISLSGTVSVFVRSLSPDAFTFLRPFAPRELPRFTATMDALTPDRRFFDAFERDVRTPSLRPGLSVLRTRTSSHSASNHLMRPDIAFARYPSACRTSFGLCRRSGLRPSLAGSPMHPAESSSHWKGQSLPALRTSRSPPVALHLASRRRSYFQLRAGERLPGVDLHHSVLIRLQTH